MQQLSQRPGQRNASWTHEKDADSVAHDAPAHVEHADCVERTQFKRQGWAQPPVSSAWAVLSWVCQKRSVSSYLHPLIVITFMYLRIFCGRQTPIWSVSSYLRTNLVRIFVSSLPCARSPSGDHFHVPVSSFLRISDSFGTSLRLG